jgi:hypothetical protein
VNIAQEDFHSNQLTIPVRRSAGMSSDPCSPNVPWHPELDRRHSDSANMAKFAHQSRVDNLITTLDSVTTTETPQQSDHNYQNTTLNLGTYVLKQD